MMRKLTLLCPTFNRHRYLERSCRFWSRHDVNVIYADGSESAYAGSCIDSPNIHYIHRSASVQQRCIEMLNIVATPYSCMISDDEFFIPSALKSCVDFLEMNPDYSSCMGRSIGFSVRNGEITFRNQYPLLQGRELSDEDKLTRLEKHFASYVPAHCYSVVRSEIFLSSMKRAWSSELDVFAIGELIEEFLIISAGKSVVLPMLYWLRSHEVPPVQSLSDIGLDRSKVFSNWWQDAVTHSERDTFCSDLSLATSPSIEKAQVMHIFDLYVQRSYRRQAMVIGFPLLRAPLFFLRKFISLFRLLKSSCLGFANRFFSPMLHGERALQELRSQGVMIDEDGLAECLVSIKESLIF